MEAKAGRGMGVLTAVAVALVGVSCGVRSTGPGGDDELALLQREPVVQYRAPGTELRTGDSTPGRVDRTPFFPDEVHPTRITQTFNVEGDPAQAVEAYIGHATASGWQLVETACSSSERTSRAVLVKDLPGFRASLVLTGRAPVPPAPLLLDFMLSSEPPPGPAGAGGVGLQPGSLHCVRQVDAEDPDLRPPSSSPTWTPAELCALLPLAEAQAANPRIERAVPEVSDRRPGCFFKAPHRTFAGRETTWIAVSDAFDTPRALYLDRRHPASPADETLFLLTTRTGIALEGAWIATSRGPVELFVGDLDPGTTLALARSIQTRAGA
jgi:hypothetical protein